MILEHSTVEAKASDIMVNNPVTWTKEQILCWQTQGFSGQTWPQCVSGLSQSSAQAQCSPSTGDCRTWSGWSWLSPAGGDLGSRRRHCWSLIFSLSAQPYYEQDDVCKGLKCAKLTCHFQQQCFCNEWGHWGQYSPGPGKSLHICRWLEASGHQLYGLLWMDLTWALQM